MTNNVKAKDLVGSGDAFGSNLYMSFYFSKTKPPEPFGLTLAGPLESVPVFKKLRRPCTSIWMDSKAASCLEISACRLCSGNIDVSDRQN